jgi:hypothetical protein
MSKRLLLGWLAAPLILLGFNGCAPPVYFAKSIRGTVIDAETQQPIEGAVVVADWILLTNILGFAQHDTHLKVEEAVTDASGNYVIRCWGPRLRPPFKMLDYIDPNLTVFKSGFEPLVLDNIQAPWRWMVRSSQWDGETLKLEPFRGDQKERLMQLENIFGWHGSPTPAFHEEILREQPFIGAPGYSFFRNISRLVREGL